MSNQRQPALRPPRGIRLIDRPNRPSKFGVQWRVDGQRKTKVFETREDQIAFARQLAGGVKRDGMMAYRVNEDETRQWRAFRATIGPSANLNDIARCWLKHDVTAATLPLSEAIAAFLEAKAAEGGRDPIAAGRLGRRQAPDPAPAPGGRAASAAGQAKNSPAGPLNGPADQGHPSWACLDSGLHRRCDGARWGLAHAHGP